MRTYAAPAFLIYLFYSFVLDVAPVMMYCFQFICILAWRPETEIYAIACKPHRYGAGRREDWKIYHQELRFI